MTGGRCGVCGWDRSAPDVSCRGFCVDVAEDEICTGCGKRRPKRSGKSMGPVEMRVEASAAGAYAHAAEDLRTVLAPGHGGFSREKLETLAHVYETRGRAAAARDGGLTED